MCGKREVSGRGRAAMLGFGVLGGVDSRVAGCVDVGMTLVKVRMDLEAGCIGGEVCGSSDCFSVVI